VGWGVTVDGGAALYESAASRPDAEPLDGLGDQAVLTSTSVDVLVGTTHVSANVDSSSDAQGRSSADEAATLDLARTIIAAL